MYYYNDDNVRVDEKSVRHKPRSDRVFFISRGMQLCEGSARLMTVLSLNPL